MDTTRRLLLSAGGLLVLGLIGCSSSPEVTVSSSSSNETAESAEPAPKPKPKKTRVAYLKRRSEFQTELAKKGPPPEQPAQTNPPPGVEEVTYPVGKIRLKAWVRRPLSLSSDMTKKFPAVVYFHSNFSLSAADMEACRPFTAAGFVVMTPMLRGENGNPGYFELFMGEVDDAAAAVRWLAQQPYVDRDRIYAFGHSTGGAIAALLSLMDRVPIRHSGSVGGLYDKSVFDAWSNIVPFDTSKKEEVELRLLLGNLPDMKYKHYAYIGSNDSSFENALKQFQAEMKALGWESIIAEVKQTSETPPGSGPGRSYNQGPPGQYGPGYGPEQMGYGQEGFGAEGEGFGMEEGGYGPEEGGFGMEGEGYGGEGEGGYGMEGMEGMEGMGGMGGGARSSRGAKSKAKLVIARVPGNHTESLAPALQAYLEIIRQEGAAAGASKVAGRNRAGGATRGPQLPEDFGDWTPDDFRTAARSSDLRLVEGIERLVASAPGDPLVAQLLTELLLVVGEAPRGGNGGQAPGGAPYGAEYGEGEGFGPPGAPGAYGPPEGFEPPEEYGPPEGFDSPEGFGPPGAYGPGAEAGPPGAYGPPDGAGPPEEYGPPEGFGPPGQYGPGAAYGPQGAAGQYGEGPMQGGAPQSASATEIVVRAIINGLIVNGTQPAWQTIHHLISGQITTVLQGDLTSELALASLIENYRENSPADSILQQALNSPEALRPGKPAQAREFVLRTLAGVAASVMDHLMGVPAQSERAVRRRPPGGPGGYGQYGQQYGEEGEFALDDGAEGYDVPGENDALPAGNRGRLARLAIHTHSLTAKQAQNAIAFLWRPETVSFIESQVKEVDEFSGAAAVLAVAGSLPIDSVRAATRTALYDHWQEGATPLLEAGLYSDIVRDPGLLLVLKSMPRAQQTTAPSSKRARPAGRRPGASGGDAQARFSWMNASTEFLKALTDRLQAAAAKAGTARLDPRALPIKLHPDARPQTVYSFRWPNGSTPLPPQVEGDQLVVTYVRILESRSPREVVQHYRRQLTRAQQHLFKNVTWLDYESVGSEPGLRRSTDVIFTQLGGGAGEGGGPGGELYGAAGPGGAPRGNADARARFSIDILVIETRNPRTSQTAAR